MQYAVYFTVVRGNLFCVLVVVVIVDGASVVDVVDVVSVDARFVGMISAQLCTPLWFSWRCSAACCVRWSCVSRHLYVSHVRGCCDVQFAPRY